MTLDEIARLCRAYAEAQSRLADLAGTIRDEQQRAVHSRLHSLRLRIAAVSSARSELEGALKASRPLFEKPRTRMLEGIKVGWKKQPGRLVIADEARTTTRMLKDPALAPLVVVKQHLNRAGMLALDAKTLASVGASIEATGDALVLKSDRDDIDKLVAALLDDVDEA